MRRPLSLSALAALVCAVGLARATTPKDPPPELLETACSSGLLLQPADAAPQTDAAPADEAPADDSTFADAGLFGGSDSDGDKGDSGDKKEKKAKPKPKPKTRLLRPRTDQDKADCPGKVSAFYRAHGGQFNAVPAPANLSAEQIESNIDRAYAASFGPAKGALMSDLKGEDLSKKWDVVNKIFDGIGPKQPLDDAAFGVTVSNNLHALVNDKVILPSDLGGKTPEELTAKAAGDAPAAPKPLPPGMTEHRNPKIEGQVPALGAKLPIKPPEAFLPVPPAFAPADPGWLARSYQDARARASDYVSSFGHPEHSIANYEGRGEGNMPPFVGPLPEGSDASINVRLPQATGLSPHCEPGCYGTQKMINLLVEMGADFSTYYKGERTLSVGGISKKGGGYFPPHVSHQKGIDADISFQSNHGFDVYANAMIVASVIRAMPNFRHINGQEYILCDQSKHAALGWGLDRLVEQKVLTAEQAARGKSVLQHWPGHNDHFHVRVLMPPNPN